MGQSNLPEDRRVEGLAGAVLVVGKPLDALVLAPVDQAIGDSLVLGQLEHAVGFGVHASFPEKQRTRSRTPKSDPPAGLLPMGP